MHGLILGWILQIGVWWLLVELLERDPSRGHMGAGCCDRGCHDRVHSGIIPRLRCRTPHWQPLLVSDLLPGLIIPALYSTVELKLERSVDLGPFKHKVREHGPRRDWGAPPPVLVLWSGFAESFEIPVACWDVLYGGLGPTRRCAC